MGCIISRSSEDGEMRSSRSPAAAAVLGDDDLLSEIILRLPPQPSSLPRASLVCKRWRSLVADPRFVRRFRRHHRRNPPLLGFFRSDGGLLKLVQTLEAPNRLPPGDRFSVQLDDGGRFQLHGCRHGLVLFFDAARKQLHVWDPVTADHHRIAVPAGFYRTVSFGSAHGTFIHGTVLRSPEPEDAQHFQVALAVVDDKDKQHSRALACLYSSNTSLWRNLVSTPIPSDTSLSKRPFIVKPGKPARLVGNSLYWLLEGNFVGNFVGLLEFDLERQNLTVIPVPVDVYAEAKHSDLMVMRAEGGRLGLLFLLDFTAQLWKRTTNGDGVASWVLGRTIELDKLLSLHPEGEGVQLWIPGYAEDSNVVLLQTFIGLFMIHLESLQFKKLSERNLICSYHPFESVYAAVAHTGRDIICNARTRSSDQMNK